MKKLFIENIEDFMPTLMDSVCEIFDTKEKVVVVGDYDFICDLFNEYFTYANEGEYRLVFSELEMPDFDGYEDAFVLEFSGKDGEVWITKPYNEYHDCYNRYFADVAYVQKEFVDKWVKNNPDNVTILTSTADEPMVSNKTGKSFVVDDDGKGFNYSSNTGNSYTNIVFKTNDKLSEDYINLMRHYLEV